MTLDSPPSPPTSEPAASHFQRPLTVRRLKWLAFLASIVFLVVFEAARHALLPYLTNCRSNLLMDAFVAVASSEADRGMIPIENYGSMTDEEYEALRRES